MTVDELLTAIHSSPYPVYLNGDICDSANCKKKDLPLLLTTMQLLNENFNYIRGNHDLNILDAPDFMLINDGKILITHSDIEQWGKERSDKFREQTPGAGWFKRNLISRPLDHLRRYWAVRPNDRLIAAIRAWKIKHPTITTVICSHSHPNEPVFFVVDGIFCVITPRGVNDFGVMDDGQIAIM
jgi:predicted phosphodiesterase